MQAVAVNPIVGVVVGVLGFSLLGYALVCLSEGRRFRDQVNARKRLIACVAVAQWPYMYLAAVSIMSLVGL